MASSDEPDRVAKDTKLAALEFPAVDPDDEIKLQASTEIATPTKGLERMAPNIPERVGTMRPREWVAASYPMEMRQIAGLTAGSVMPLNYGAFQFTESIEGTSFSVRVADDNTTMVLPGTANAIVDDVNVVEPTAIGLDGVLNVRSACFMIRPPRKPLSPMIKANTIESMLTAPGPIKVPDFEATDPIPQPTDVPGIQDAPPQRTKGGAPLLLSADEWEFLGRVRLARSAMAERHRQLHPHPEELKSRLSGLEPGLWDRSSEHDMFGRFAIAYANIPWEPRFDNPDKIPETLHPSIFALRLLPWIPVTANLLYGPLGIVGTRSAALACTRHAMISLACLTAPGETEFSIVTAKSNVDAWAWTSALPRSFFPSNEGRYTVVVADGMEYFESAGLDHEQVKQNEIGLIVLAERSSDLPSYCGTIVEVLPDGTCEVTNHLGESVNGTPIGVTEAFAHDMATRITDILDPLGQPAQP